MFCCQVHSALVIELKSFGYDVIVWKLDIESESI